MRFTVDTEYVLDRLKLDEYGFGIPFGFLFIGLIGLYASWPGIEMWSAMTGYGRIGLLIVLAGSILSFILCGATYREIDTDWWLLAKWRDGPGAE